MTQPTEYNIVRMKPGPSSYKRGVVMHPQEAKECRQGDPFTYWPQGTENEPVEMLLSPQDDWIQHDRCTIIPLQGRARAT